LSRLRLNRFLALSGLASRRASDQIIREGRVSVDGETVSTPGFVVDSRRQKVRVDGRLLRPVSPRVYMLNKPPGVLATVSDPHGGETVLDLARRAGVTERVYPVGRLDLKSRGLILLSNDGDLSHRLLHPRFGVVKIYRVRVNLPITKTQMRRFASGVQLSDGRTRPCEIRALPGRASYELKLKEGRKRQIRRMFEAFGRRVTDLERVAIGPLRLGRLPEGEMRPLEASERDRLKEAVGLS
jgi:23S rRNA pseudouridine2605 synthase